MGGCWSNDDPYDSETTPLTQGTGSTASSTTGPPRPSGTTTKPPPELGSSHLPSNAFASMRDMNYDFSYVPPKRSHSSDSLHARILSPANVHSRVVVENLPDVVTKLTSDDNITVRHALAHNHVLDEQDDLGRTGLYIAAEKGLPKVTKEIIGSGATLDVRRKGGKSPLMAALENGHIETANILLDAGADTALTLFNDYSILHAAAAGCVSPCPDGKNHCDACVASANLIRRVVDEDNINLEVEDRVQKTALHIAAAKANSEVIKVLLEAGADPNIPDGSGRFVAEIVSNAKGTNTIDRARALDVIWKATE